MLFEFFSKYEIRFTLAGDVLPRDCRYRVGRRALSRLPHTDLDRNTWVRAGNDAVLIAEATGVIIDILEDWFGR